MIQILTISELIDKAKDSVKREWVDDMMFFHDAIKDPSFEGAIVGSFSLYNVKTRTCYVARGTKSLDYPISPMSISRRIISQLLDYHGRKAYPKMYRKDDHGFTAAPLYARPYEGNCYYFDLKSAFWQIYIRMPFLVRRHRDEWDFAPDWNFQALPDDLQEWKLIRNGVVGCWRSQYSTRIKNGSYERKKTAFPTCNYQNWDYIMATLHTVANVALSCGAKYIHTDGYIFPAKSQWGDFLDWTTKLGFRLELKGQGHAKIYGIGRYTIGDLSTKVTGRLPPIDKVDRTLNTVVSLTQFTKYNPHWKEIYAVIFK